MVKADDLLPLEEEVEEKHVNTRKTIKQEREEGEINEDDIREQRKKQLTEADASQKKLTFKDLDLKLGKKKKSKYSSDEEDDNIKKEVQDNDFRLDNDDDAFNELHSILDKVRKRVVTSKIDEVNYNYF